jgi:hypothetical protein
LTLEVAGGVNMCPVTAMRTYGEDHFVLDMARQALDATGGRRVSECLPARDKEPTRNSSGPWGDRTRCPILNLLGRPGTPHGQANVGEP